MDTRLDIERQKYLEYKEQMRISMRDSCERCSERNTDCPFYDSDEEYYDYEECYRVKGYE